MISQKTELTLIVTIFAIFLTTLVYLIPAYAPLWLSLEVIIIPTFYLVGYELILEKQRKDFERDSSLIQEHAEKLEKENYRLRLRLQK